MRPYTIKLKHTAEGKYWFHIKSKKQEIQVYVTKTGKIRLFNYETGKELVEESKDD